MKILVFADIHGDFEKLSSVIDGIRKKTIESTDLVVCPGDFTDMFSAPDEFSQIEVADMVLQRLMSLKKPMFCVPGNHDPYDILRLFDEYGVNLHNKAESMGGLKFIGWGGAATPFDTVFEPSEEESAESLSALGAAESKKEKAILVVHNPPRGTNMDMTRSGEHVGSDAVRKFITENNPVMAISAHIHEALGTDRLGRTTLFNAGPVFSGNYGIVDVAGSRVKCEIKKQGS